MTKLLLDAGLVAAGFTLGAASMLAYIYAYYVWKFIRGLGTK